jgi:hypothetical protein
MHEILDGLGDQGHKSTAAAGLAHTLCVLGRFDEAEGYASEAVSVAADDDFISQAMTLRVAEGARRNWREKRTRCSTSRRTHTARAIFAGRGVATKTISPHGRSTSSVCSRRDGATARSRRATGDVWHRQVVEEILDHARRQDVSAAGDRDVDRLGESSGVASLSR